MGEGGAEQGGVYVCVLRDEYRLLVRPAVFRLSVAKAAVLLTVQLRRRAFL